MKKIVVFLGCLMLVQVIALSQTGPGGVENSATVQGFWFGAGDISAAPADGDDVVRITMRLIRVLQRLHFR